jgi:hypothetical protein
MPSENQAWMYAKKPTVNVGLPTGVNPMNPYTWVNSLAPQASTSTPTQPRTTATQPSMNTAALSTALAGGAGGAGGTSTTPKNVAELRAMYAKALAELQRQQGVSGETIAGSVGRMKADPYNTANAYAALRGVTPNVAANPVAQYAQSTGLSAEQAAEAQRMAEAAGQDYGAVSQNIADIMRTSQDVANQSRMADIGLIETGSQQDLATQANMLNLLLKQNEIGAVSGLQQRNLENELAVRNALTGQISNIFSGQDVAPESILKLVEATMAKLNTSRWTGV